MKLSRLKIVFTSGDDDDIIRTYIRLFEIRLSFSYCQMLELLNEYDAKRVLYE